MEFFRGRMATGVLERPKHPHPLSGDVPASDSKRLHRLARREASHSNLPPFYRCQIFTDSRAALHGMAHKWPGRVRP
jgi:hypothetical protein